MSKRSQMLAEEARERAKPKPDPEAPLGEGGRFAALTQKLARRKGVRNPRALAASIGRKDYGAKRFGQLSHGGH